MTSLDLRQLAGDLDVGHLLEYPLVKVGGSAFTLISLFTLVFWIVGLVLLNSLLRRLIVQRLLARTRLDPGVRFAVTRIIGYTFMTLGVYVALLVNGVNLSSLAVIAGALGVGLGFGLQNIVENFVSGLIILAERPIAIGDRIEVAGVAGRVQHIALRSTTVVTNDNISIIVPNSDLVTQSITNWSHGDPKVRLRIPIGVAYGSDPEQVRRVLLGVAAAHPDVLKVPEAAVFFDAFGDSSLNFELAVWTTDRAFAPRRFRSEINFAIEKALREHGIEIPFPQRVVHLRPAPPAS
ncbi:MAG TPA: mechanosensitive ion channel domain-containing protein [Lacunisphaera sp.]|nr:mechanosensitive ion channel domain-containing protein [Lacunisphaera sp.]